MSMITKITPDQRDAALALAEASGLFNTEGIEQIEERLDDYLAGGDALWLAAADETGRLAGLLYCIPEPMTDRTWNILMLVVDPQSHGKGHGRALMKHVEERLAKGGERLLIVETSSLDGFERARDFYEKCGYTEEARIRDFYTTGDDKVVFLKQLSVNS